MSSQWDRWFSYKTAKTVDIRDRRLGLLYLFIVFMIVLYIVVYVFIIQKGYLETQFTQGTVATKVKGTAFADGHPRTSYFDEADMVVPPLESSAIFIVTRRQITEGQVRAWCPPDPSKPEKCTSSKQCENSIYPTTGECINGECKYFQWCPHEDDTGNSRTTIIENIPGALDSTIWFKGAIRFDKLGDAFYSTITDKKPVTEGGGERSPNLFSVGQLIDKLPREQQTDDIAEYGAILKVFVNWNCDTSKSKSDACKLKYVVNRLDNTGGPQEGGGFNYRAAFYEGKYANGNSTRTLIKYSGVRMFVTSSGKGYRVSLSQIILTIASGLALFGIATFVTDTLMLFGLDKDDRYSKLKFEETKNLYDSDHREPTVSLINSTPAVSYQTGL